MKLLSGFAGKRSSMRRKLFAYMFLLATLVLTLLLSGLVLLGQFTGTKQKTYETLDFQAEVFSGQIQAHVEDLAVMGIHLSANTTKAIERFLTENHMVFSQINDSEERVEGIQRTVFGILKQKLLEANCSGAFIVLNATVNSAA